LVNALAVLTGLRRGELTRLLWADVHLDAERPWIEVRASTTKNKRPATVFLVPQLVPLLKKYRGLGVGLVLPSGVPSVATLRQDLVAAGVQVEDERGWRVDFHALRHTYASLMRSARIDEDSRVKMMRHSERRQTDNYTDPKFAPLHEGMEQLALLLPSSIASLNSGNSGSTEGNVVQAAPATSALEVVASAEESPFLSKSVHAEADLALASPRGFEPRFSP